MLVEDALEGEVADGILHGGVGLEEHALLQTVEVDAGNEGLLFVVVGFFLDDGCKDDDVFEGFAKAIGSTRSSMKQAFLRSHSIL